MPICPQCQHECEPGIDVCPSCGASLTASPADEKQEREVTGPAAQQWKLLYLATSRPAAEFLHETLKGAGVDSVVKYRGRFFGRGASFGLGAVTAAVDAEVWVRREQFGRAQEIRRQTVGDEDSAHGFLPTENQE